MGFDETKQLWWIPVGGFHKVKLIDYKDTRPNIPLNNVSFTGELRPEQHIIQDKMLQNGKLFSGIIQAKCGFGKTFLGSSLIGSYGHTALVLTHTKLLQNQWLEHCNKFISGTTIGHIGDGFYRPAPITVGLYLSVLNHLEELREQFSLIIVDECLDYDSLITTRNGKEKIGKLVNNLTKTEVLSFNQETNEYEYKPIEGWFKNPQSSFRQLKFNIGSLKCTDNHTIYVYENNKIVIKPSIDIKIGDKIIADKTSDTIKIPYLLNKKYNHIMLGLILGDGNLENDRNNITRLRITHGEKQLEYLQYKNSIIKNLAASYNTGKSGYKSENSIYQLQSKSFYDNENWISDIYNNKRSKNNIPLHISNQLTKESWALLYQDDGSINNGLIRFSFCEFNDESCHNLILSLNTIFGIKAKIMKDKIRNFNYIDLDKESSRIFIENIANYIHPVLEYKMGDYKPSTYVFTPITLSSELYESFSYKIVTDIKEVKSSTGYRYNIAVSDHHNYIANGILVSNCHKAPAKVFSSVVNGLSSKVKIGLSATPRRKDGWHELLPDFFGPNHIVADNAGATMPIKKVYIIQTPITLKITNPIRDWVRCVSGLAKNENYIKTIAKWTNTKIAEKRCVLIVNERLEALRQFNASIPKSRLLIGETSNEDREYILKNAGIDIDAILSNKIFYEGVSCNRLDTLALTSPTNNPITLEQILGRIQRLHPDKQEPEVLDFWYKGFAVQRTQLNRQYWYAKEGIPFEIINDNEFNPRTDTK